MPIWCDVVLSALLFALGLVGLVRWESPAHRGLCAALMLLGAAWLLFTGSFGQRLDGWAYALLALGAIPAFCLAAIKKMDADQRGKRG